MVLPGRMACESPDHLPIRVVSRRLVKASDPSIDPHVVAVSNLDLIPSATQCSITCVYPRPATGGDFGAVVAAFEAELPAFLNHFSPLAGRIVTNPSSGLPELRCHNQGAELVVADAVGVDLASLDWGVSGRSLKMIKLPYAEDVPLSVHLVSFACGGFAVVWATSSLIGDCHGLATVVRAWSEFLRLGGLLTAGVRHDRSVFLRPRDPPPSSHVSASLNAMFTPRAHEREVNALTAEQSFVERLYYVEGRDVARLRDAASRNGRRATRVQALSAYLWKALAAVVLAASSSPAGGGEQPRCRMGWWVDVRQRLAAPECSLRDYLGNATTYAVGEAAVSTVLESTLADVAAMVGDAIASVNYDERCRQLVDWVEERKPAGAGRVVETATVGRGSPTLSQMVWASFRGDTDFGFGEAALAMPVAPSGRRCSAYLCVVSRPANDGPWVVSAYVWPRLAAALEADEQRIFKPLTAQHLGFTRAKAVVNDARPRL